MLETSMISSALQQTQAYLNEFIKHRRYEITQYMLTASSKVVLCLLSHKWFLLRNRDKPHLDDEENQASHTYAKALKQWENQRKTAASTYTNRSEANIHEVLH